MTNFVSASRFWVASTIESGICPSLAITVTGVGSRSRLEMSCGRSTCARALVEHELVHARCEFASRAGTYRVIPAITDGGRGRGARLVASYRSPNASHTLQGHLPDFQSSGRYGRVSV